MRTGPLRSAVDVLLHSHELFTVQGIQRRDSGFQVVQQPSEHMILEIRAYAFVFDNTVHAGCFENFRIADARKLQELRALDNTGRQDDLPSRIDAILLTLVDELYTFGGGPIQDDSSRLCLGQDFQIRPVQVWPEVPCGSVGSFPRVIGPIHGTEAGVEAHMVTAPCVMDSLLGSGYSVCGLGEIDLERAVPVIEAGVDGAVPAVKLVASCHGHELRIVVDRRHVKSLVLEEIGSQAAPSPALVADGFPADIIAISTPTNVHEIVDAGGAAQESASWHRVDLVAGIWLRGGSHAPVVFFAADLGLGKQGMIA